MASVSDLITAVYNQLRDRLDYPVYLGARGDLVNLPLIIIEPISVYEGEEGEACYGVIDTRVTLNIYGYIQAYNKDKQIVGDDRERGVVDLARDIKLAIDYDRTFGGTAIKTVINETAFGIVDYPIREVLVNIEILYRQEKGVR